MLLGREGNQTPFFSSRIYGCDVLFQIKQGTVEVMFTVFLSLVYAHGSSRVPSCSRTSPCPWGHVSNHPDRCRPLCRSGGEWISLYPFPSLFLFVIVAVVVVIGGGGGGGVVNPFSPM